MAEQARLDAVKMYPELHNKSGECRFQLSSDVSDINLVAIY